MYSWVPEHDFLEPEGIVIEPAIFVVIQGHVGRSLHLLRLQRSAGVAYRCGIYCIKEEEWAKFDTVWEPIVLG